MRFVSLALLAMSLVPSAYLGWSNSDMPHFGESHDDAILFSSAKSLAKGDGYRVASLPGEPAQTKYPPLYPALFAFVWHYDSDFPGNLRWAMPVAWLALPLLVVLSSLMYRRWGLPVTLAAVLALNPYSILFALSLRTELLFTALLIATVLVLDRMPAVAGVLCGLAFLTRTAGIALVAAGLIVFFGRREFRNAARYALTATPFIAGWLWWTAAFGTKTNDPNLLYYIDYVRFGLTNQDWTNLHLFLWKNAWAILSGAGELLLTDPGRSMLSRSLQVTLTALMIAGLIRSWRKTEVQAYLAFAAAYTGILLLWHVPPGARFLYPLFPLLIYGLWIELSRMWTMARNSPKRVTALAASLVLTASAGVAAWTQYRFAAALPLNMAEHRRRLAANQEAFKWIRNNASERDSILAYNDPVVYLYTGRHSIKMVTPSRFLYEDRLDRMLDFQYRAVNFAIQHGLKFIYFDTRSRYFFDSEEQAKIFDRIRSDGRLEQVFESGPVVVLKLKNPA